MSSHESVVENRGARKGTVKIDVSQLVKAELLKIKDANEHTSMDSVIRELLRQPGTNVRTRDTGQYINMTELKRLEE